MRKGGRNETPIGDGPTGGTVERLSHACDELVTGWGDALILLAIPSSDDKLLNSMVRGVRCTNRSTLPWDAIHCKIRRTKDLRPIPYQRPLPKSLAGMMPEICNDLLALVLPRIAGFYRKLEYSLER